MCRAVIVEDEPLAAPRFVFIVLVLEPVLVLDLGPLTGQRLEPSLTLVPQTCVSAWALQATPLQPRR